MITKIKKVSPLSVITVGGGIYKWLLKIEEPDEIDIGEYLIDKTSGPLNLKYRVLNKEVILETQLFAKLIVEVSHPCRGE